MTLAPLRTIDATPRSVAGVVVPDSKLARKVTELVKDTESPPLFHHSSRVYYWGALTGKRRGLRVSIPSCFTPAPCSMTWPHPPACERA